MRRSSYGLSECRRAGAAAPRSGAAARIAVALLKERMLAPDLAGSGVATCPAAPEVEKRVSEAMRSAHQGRQSRSPGAAQCAGRDGR